jgi:hypothetical protein
MTRKMLTGVVALLLVGTGWVAAKTQVTAPEFELVVEAPAGPTTIRCVRGCKLMWVERGMNPNGTPQSSFEFSCSGDATARCSSARVGGWITP